MVNNRIKLFKLLESQVRANYHEHKNKEYRKYQCSLLNPSFRSTNDCIHIERSKQMVLYVQSGGQ